MLAADAVRRHVAAYYAALRAGDIEPIAALFAHDAVMRDPVGAPPATDDALRRQRYAGIAATFDAFTIDESSIVVCASEAAASWRARGTTKGGREVAFDGISTFTFDDEGRITAMSAYWDPAALLAALAGASS